MRRFAMMMAAFCFVAAGVCAYRLVVADGLRLWYIPLALAGMSALLLVCGRRMRTKEN